MGFTVGRQMDLKLTVSRQSRLFFTVKRQKCRLGLTVKNLQSVSHLSLIFLKKKCKTSFHVLKNTLSSLSTCFYRVPNHNS